MPSLTLRRVDVRSAAVVFAAVALAIGACYGVVLLVLSPAGTLGSYVAVVVGWVAAGAVTGAVAALVYNAVASVGGGLEFEVETAAPQTGTDLEDDDLRKCPSCHSVEERDREQCRVCGERLAPS